jgi:hypothetical protein
LIPPLAMKFQVVLQLPASSVKAFDEIVQVENLLVEKLDGQSEVDGHNFGSEEANIFVHTDDPHRTFDEIQTILSGHCLWTRARIAYRQVDGAEYSMLWPQGATTFNVR